MLEFNSRNMRMWSRLGPSGAVGVAASEIVSENKKVVMLTSDLCFFSGLERFKKEYPGNFFNFGIAEQNMIGAAAGMAKEGFIPFANTYASFCSSRCADQVRVNMSYMNLPIKLIGLTAGFGAGILGATHMSVEDISVMRALPNIDVISPADCSEIIKALCAVEKTNRPAYIRLTGPMNTPIVYKEDYDFEIGKAIKLRAGKDICFIATGSVVSQALKAADFMEQMGYSSSVINMHTIKPLDVKSVQEAANEHKLLVTVEEHSVIGGLGSAVSEVLCRNKTHSPLLMLGINDYFPYAGDYNYQLEQVGLTAEKIKERVLQEIEKGF